MQWFNLPFQVVVLLIIASAASAAGANVYRSTIDHLSGSDREHLYRCRLIFFTRTRAH